MEKLQGFTDHVMLYVKTLVKWLLAAALIGTVGGAVGSLFHLGVEYATELRTEVPALLYALPLAGVLIVALYRFLRTQGVGTNAVLDAVHQGRELPILLIPAIFLATLLTHLAGGSAGREGAALQIGGDLGEHFGKMLRMDDKDCRLATLCGMSALFSALFGTPLAAVFFALEVVSIGVLYYSGLIPCITSSLVAYAVSLRFGIEPMRFAVAAPETGALTLARAAVLALGCALVSILFCEMLHRTEHLTERLVKNDYLRAFLGGCLVIALTLLAGCRDYNGAGGHVIVAALGGTSRSVHISTERGGISKLVFSSRIAPLSSSAVTNSRVTPATPKPMRARSTSRLLAPSSISGERETPCARKYFSRYTRELALRSSRMSGSAASSCIE